MQTITVRHDYTVSIPEYGEHWDMCNLQEAVRRSGSHFFDRDTMRFFRSRVDDYTFAGPDGWYFVTSEKHVSHFARINEPRRYTLRRLSVRVMDDGRTDLWLAEVENFQYFKTLNAARNLARKLAKTGCAECSECHYRLSTIGACAECVERAERKAVNA